MKIEDFRNEMKQRIINVVGHHLVKANCVREQKVLAALTSPDLGHLQLLVGGHVPHVQLKY